MRVSGQRASTVRAAVPVTAKAFFALALAFLLLSVAVDFLPVREASDLDHYRPYTGTAPWSIAHIRPGDPIERHATRLGPPSRDQGGASGAPRVVQWTSPRDLTLTLDARGEIVEVLADSVTAGEETLVSTGMSRAEVERVLGRGSLRTSTRPTGSGVISLGWTEVSKTLSYDNGGAVFEITLVKDGVAYVRAFRQPRT